MFAAKLLHGEILIFDKDLNIQKRFQSSLEPTYWKSDLVSDGNTLITCGENGIEYWDTYLSPCKLIHSNYDIGCIYALTLLPNKQIAAGGRNNVISIIQPNGEISHSHATPKEKSRIYSLLWVSDSEALWIGDHTGNIYIWEKPMDIYIEDIYTFRTLNTDEVNPMGPIYALEELKGSRNVCSGGYGIVGVWGYEGNLLYKIDSQRNMITSVCESGEGNIIIGDGEGYIEVWAGNGDLGFSSILSFRLHQGGIYGRGIQGLGVGYGDELYVSGSVDMKIKLISLKVEGEVLKEMGLVDQVTGITKICVK